MPATNCQHYVNSVGVTLALAAGFGLAAALAYASQFLGLWTQSTARQLLTLGYLTAFFGLIAFGVWRRVLRPRWLTFAPAGRRAWLIGTLLCAAWLVVAIPISPRLPPSHHTLAIVATGQRNPAAQGSEVWLQRLERSDGLPLPLTDLQPEGDWEMRDNVWLSYQNQPATLRWQGPMDGSLRLILTAHPWSGLVRVVWDGQDQMVDLYDPAGTTREITLAVATAPTGLTPLALSLYVAWTVALAGLLLGVGLVLTTWRGGGGAPVRVSRWAWLGYAAPCIVVWTVWLLAFWPGFMSSDSSAQWGQMLSGQYDDWHPAFHTLTNWLITRAWLSPAMVALTQVIVMGALIGQGLALLRRLGVARGVVWAILGLFLLSPLHATLPNTLWKDVPYTAATVGLTLIIGETILGEGDWLSRRFAWVTLGSVGALAALYRHNGVIVGLGSLVGLGMTFPRGRRRVLLSLILALALIFTVRGPLYRWVGVVHQRTTDLQPPIHQIAAHLAADTPLTPADREYLDSIRPVDDDWQYTCFSIAPILWGLVPFQRQPIERDPGRLVAVWWRLTWQAPAVNLRHLLCSSALIWHITNVPGGWVYGVPVHVDPDGEIRTIYRDRFGLTEPSPLPDLRDALSRWLLRSLEDDRIWIVWRPALYLYLAIAGALIAALRRRRWQILLLLLPVLLNALSLLPASLSPDSRFHYAAFVVGLFGLGWLFIPAAGHHAMQEPD
jgi:hypothetical protein